MIKAKELMEAIQDYVLEEIKYKAWLSGATVAFSINEYEESKDVLEEGIESILVEIGRIEALATAASSKAGQAMLPHVLYGPGKDWYGQQSIQVDTGLSWNTEAGKN